jgi:uncharacterized protein (DUF2141 family)
VSGHTLAKRAPRATALIVACGFLFGGAAMAAQPATLTVTVRGADIDAGFVHVALYDKASWIASEAEPVRTASRHPGEDVTVIPISDVKRGKYVIEVYQDRNNNGQIDAREPYGISNNVCRHKSDCHPSFQDAHVTVKAGDNAISIDLD